MSEDKVKSPLPDREKAIKRVEEAIEEIKQGRMVILVDDEDRENEGDLCMAAEKVTPDHIAFMATYGRGLICLALTPEKVEQLKLPMMVSNNQSKFGTAFTVSIEAREGVTTGISAKDRATTILTAIAPNAKPEDLVTPGHVFPLRAARGGVLERTGQTEGSVDLARLAGLLPYGVICEIMKEDGTMARMPDLIKFAQKHKLKIVSIADIIQYRLEKESLIRKVTEKEILIRRGKINLPVKMVKYETVEGVDQQELIAFLYGDIKVQDEPIPCRVHKDRGVFDIFGIYDKEDYSLDTALEIIKAEGRGVILFISSFSSTEKETQGILPKEKEIRNFGIGAQVLKDLGLRRLSLLTNHTFKFVALEAFGLKIEQWIPIEDPT